MFTFFSSVIYVMKLFTLHHPFWILSRTCRLRGKAVTTPLVVLKMDCSAIIFIKEQYAGFKTPLVIYPIPFYTTFYVTSLSICLVILFVNSCYDYLYLILNSRKYLYKVNRYIYRPCEKDEWSTTFSGGEQFSLPALHFNWTATPSGPPPFRTQARDLEYLR